MSIPHIYEAHESDLNRNTKHENSSQHTQRTALEAFFGTRPLNLSTKIQCLLIQIRHAGTAQSHPILHLL
jgi:hypothetical protein